MPSSELAHFLNVALDVQAPPYPGIHVDFGLMVASNGVMLVTKRFDDKVFLRGKGAISPKAAKVLVALVEATYIGSIEVNDNRVTVTAQSTWYDEKAGAEVAGGYREVTLPELYCRQIPIKRMVEVLDDKALGWEVLPLSSNPKLKTLKEANAKDYVALVDSPHGGYELFRLRNIDDAHWYSVAQLRKGLRLFGKHSSLIVRRSKDGWLAFSDQWGYTFAITPFVKRN
jgi:hypothetical protein